MHQVSNNTISDLNKMEHKAVNFSIIKAKIIKTDELLNKLREAKEKCAELKNKCKQSNNALVRCQLESSRHATRAQESEEKNTKLAAENNELSENCKFMEDKYNNHVVESMKTIKDLQDELQMMKELKAEVKTVKSPKPTKVRNLKGEEEKQKEQVQELLKEINMLREENKKTADDLQNTNFQYKKEIEEFKAQIKQLTSNITQLNVNKGKLENQIAYLSCVKDEHAFLEQENINLHGKLTEMKLQLEQQKIIKDEKEIKEISLQTDLENNNETSYIEKIALCEKIISELKIDVESKTVEIASYSELKEKCKHLQEKINILTDTTKIEIETNTVCIQTDPIKETLLSVQEFTKQEVDSDYEIDTIDDILKEMTLPRIISPFSSHENSMDVLIESPIKIPSIVVTPSTPTEKVQNIAEFPIPKQDVDVQTEEKVETMDYLKKFRFTYNDFVRQQHKLLKRRRLATKRKLSRRRKKFEPYKDGFLSSLRTLKKSNIHFVISNDNTLQHYPSHYTEIYNPPPNYNLHHDSKVAPSVAQNIETLDCVSKNCGHKYMMLYKGTNGMELLGFFNIKPEISTPIGFQHGYLLENKPKDPQNTPRQDSQFIDHLADVVCQKLKNEGVFTKTPKIVRSFSHQSDSLCSETETELERLFRNTPNDILKQNKMLLEEARLQRSQISTDDSCQSRNSDIRHSATTVEVDSNLTFFTPIVNLDNTGTEVVSNSFGDFKVPFCPKLLSPISPGSRYTKFGSSAESSPIRSSVRALSFTPRGSSVSSSDVSVTSNTSFYINDYLAQGGISTPSVNMLLESFSESKVLETSSPLRRASVNSDRQQGSSEDQYCLKSPESVNNYTNLISPKIIPLERSQPRQLRSSFSPEPNSKRLSGIGSNGCQNNSDQLFNNTGTSPRSLRRSKRISEKSEDAVKRKQSRSFESESSDVEEASSKTNLIQERLNEKVSEVKLINEKSPHKTFEKKSLSGVQKKRKPVSKLQTRVLKELKLRRKMRENGKTSDVSSCDNLDNNDCKVRNNSERPSHSFVNKYDVKSEQGTTQKLNGHSSVNQNHVHSVCSESKQKENGVNNLCTEKTLNRSDNPKLESNHSISLKNTNHNKTKNKINIVQNILIPPNSNVTVDLLKKAQQPKIPANDVVSAIMENMDKDRPRSVMKNHVVLNSPRRMAPVLVDDKHFRTNVLDIAESLQTNSKHDGHTDTPQLKDVRESKFLQKGRSLSDDMKIRLKTLYNCLNKETIPPEVILLFKYLHLDVIIDVILNQVAKDFNDKPTIQYVNAPLLTEKQKLFLTLLLELEKEKYPMLTKTFLTRTEEYFFYRGCNINAALPIVRLYLTVCRLKSDIVRARKFVSDSFYFLGDTAIPIFFTVLTNWVEVMPHFNNWQSYPLSKVLFQIVQLKHCPRPGYNLFPLKCLLSQYYGFPKERFNCDELFQELFNQYLNAPSKDSDIAVRLLAKNKPKPWVYQKINQFFKPLVYKIPAENVNFKATVIIFIGKLSQNFRPKISEDLGFINELRRWFLGLVEDGAPKIINDSVLYVMDKLPKPKVNKRKLQANKRQN